MASPQMGVGWFLVAETVKLTASDNLNTCPDYGQMNPTDKFCRGCEKQLQLTPVVEPNLYFDVSFIMNGVEEWYDSAPVVDDEFAPKGFSIDVTSKQRSWIEQNVGFSDCSDVGQDVVYFMDGSCVTYWTGDWTGDQVYSEIETFKKPSQSKIEKLIAIMGYKNVSLVHGVFVVISE